MDTLGAFLTGFNSDKRNRDLASRDLLHQFGGCQVGEIVPTYVIDRNDRLAVVLRHEQEGGLHFANNARVVPMARSGLVAIALLPQNVLLPIKAAALHYWKRRCVSVRNLVLIAWKWDDPTLVWTVTMSGPSPSGRALGAFAPGAAQPTMPRSSRANRVSARRVTIPDARGR